MNNEFDSKSAYQNPKSETSSKKNQRKIK